MPWKNSGNFRTFLKNSVSSWNEDCNNKQKPQLHRVQRWGGGWGWEEGGSHALGTEQRPTRRTKTTFLSASVFIKFPRSTTVLNTPSPEILHLKLFWRIIFHISVGVGEVHSLYGVESGRTSRVLKDSQTTFTIFLFHSFTHSVFPSLPFQKQQRSLVLPASEPFECKSGMFLAILHWRLRSLAVLDLLNQWPFIYLIFIVSKISGFLPDIFERVFFVCLYMGILVFLKIPFGSTSGRREFRCVFSIYHFNLEPWWLLLLVIYFSLRLAEKV